MYGSERVYKKLEIIGVSKTGVEDAIKVAIGKARRTVENLSWFELQEVRGHIAEDGSISEYQVVLKVSFMLKE